MCHGEGGEHGDTAANPRASEHQARERMGARGPGCRRQLMGGETDRGQGCNLSEEEPFTEGEGGKEAERNCWREGFLSSRA